MASRATERPGRVRGGLAVLPLCVLVFLACEDPEGSDPEATGGAAAASNAGEGGEASSAAGSGGGDTSAGEGGATSHGAGQGGDAGAGGEPAARPCSTDADCDGTKYCAGPELCVPDPDTGIKTCQTNPVPPCWPDDCDEANRTCDCSIEERSDRDNDGAHTKYCAAVWNAPEDCDDGDGQRSPEKTEICDDDDVDEDCDPTTVGFRDGDGDDFADAACRNFSFVEGRYYEGDDCDDGDGAINPDAEEICDEIDNNCNGEVDELGDTPNEELHAYYPDEDGDGWGAIVPPILSRCARWHNDEFVSQAKDCDDKNYDVGPGREELCNGVDDDCKGGIDNEPKDMPTHLDTEIVCEEGAWKIISCPTDRLDCDQDAKLGCETPATTLCNCRACGNRCSFSCGATGCEEIAGVSVGYQHACAVAAPLQDGTPSGPGRAVCWGRNQSGQIGTDLDKIRQSDFARAVALEDVKMVAAGYAHTCAVATDENGVFCWGDNGFGQLGTHLGTKHFTPIEVDFTFAPELSFVMVTTGQHHSCSVASHGELYCWGRGGRLGNGDVNDSSLPARVRRRRGEEVSYVDDAGAAVAGHTHSCLLTTTGGVECWGANDLGQLGDGFATASSLVAQPVPGLSLVDSLCAGAAHACALTNGQVYCWGDNTSRQLGIDADSDGTARLVPGVTDTVALTCGTSFTCATAADRTVRCWGSNQRGETGREQGGPSSTPTLIPVQAEVSAAFAGGYQACAVTTLGQTYCWGDNEFGQLGSGVADTAAHPLPLPLAGLDDAPSCDD